MKRFRISKRKSIRSFGKHALRTRAVNMAPPPMRGGYRI